MEALLQLTLDVLFQFLDNTAVGGGENGQVLPVWYVLFVMSVCSVPVPCAGELQVTDGEVKNMFHRTMI